MGSAPGLPAATTAGRRSPAGESWAVHAGRQPATASSGRPDAAVRDAVAEVGGFPRPSEASVLTPCSTEEGAGRPPSRL